MIRSLCKNYSTLINSTFAANFCCPAWSINRNRAIWVGPLEKTSSGTVNLQVTTFELVSNSGLKHLGVLILGDPAQVLRFPATPCLHPHRDEAFKSYRLVSLPFAIIDFGRTTVGLGKLTNQVFLDASSIVKVDCICFFGDETKITPILPRSLRFEIQKRIAPSINVSDQLKIESLGDSNLRIF